MDEVELRKLDDVFASERTAEQVLASELIGLIGAVVRKTADDEDIDRGTALARMQRAYLLAKHAERGLADECNDDAIGVPPELLAAVKKDADGADASVLPLSDAMRIIGERLNVDGAPGDDSTWATDLASKDDAGEINWGSDPDWA